MPPERENAYEPIDRCIDLLGDHGQWVTTGYRPGDGHFGRAGDAHQAHPQQAAGLDKLTDALKCQLRHDMLHTYYRHREGRTIRQYELENFLYLYRRYKALGGNSFIDRIKSEIDEWEVIS